MPDQSGSRSAAQPLVSVVIPTMNEVGHLDKAVASVRAQTYPRELVEILIVDGGSTDGTVERAREMGLSDPSIRLFGGPGTNCPTALNLGIAQARGDVVWYLGGHGEADPRFLELGVRALAAEPNIGCVGGRIVPAGTGLVARANIIARFSVFGVGRGVYTTRPTRHDIETVQWGLYRKHALEEAGLFDPELQFGEDEELNYRLRRKGYRVVYEPDMVITYFSRPTFHALYRQYRNYGRARVRVIRKHPSFFRPKHIVPSTTIMALAAASFLPLAQRSLWPVSVTVGLGYFGFVGVAAAKLSLRERFPRPHYVAVSLMVLHFGYGWGMLRGAVNELVSLNRR